MTSRAPALSASMIVAQQMEAVKGELRWNESQWKVTGELGKGGSGVVYKVRNVELHFVIFSKGISHIGFQDYCVIIETVELSNLALSWPPQGTWRGMEVAIKRVIMQVWTVTRSWMIGRLYTHLFVCQNFDMCISLFNASATR